MRYHYFLLILIIFILPDNHLFAQQEPVDLTATDNAGYVGEEISIDIKVNQFTNIISFQASINWDPALLSFKEVSNFGIKDFTIDDFGTTAADQGHVRFLWIPDDATAVTVADGTVLFTATFTVISAGQPTAAITFTDVTSTPPFTMEFSNGNYDVVDVNTTEGAVSLFSTPADMVNITSDPNTSCDEKVFNGSLEANVNGNVNDYIFYWYAGTEIKDTPDFIGYLFENIPPGNYALQVLDIEEQIFVQKINTSIDDNPVATPDLITEINNLPQSSCSENADKFTGTIEIEVNNDQPADTYQIAWWKGAFGDGEELSSYADAFLADILDVGNYEVSVENLSTGCRAYLQTRIVEELVQFQVSVSSTKNNYCKDGANGTVSAIVPNGDAMDLRYFWFQADDVIDTTQALYKGSIYENISGDDYKTWVIDLNSDCFDQEVISLEDSAIIPEPIITLRDDTLFANDENANWLRNSSLLNVVGPYLVPSMSGSYGISIVNQYNCQAYSEDIYFGITGLDEISEDISVYPNPFHKFIRISNPFGTLENIKIYDTKGILMNEINYIKDQFIDIPLNGSSNGIYLLKIQKEGKIITRKVVQNLSK